MAAKAHIFKTDPEPFTAMWRGDKRAEFRFVGDRQMPQPGELMELKEFDRATQKYTGGAMTVEVLHVQQDYGIPEGYVMISFRILQRHGKLTQRIKKKVKKA